MEKYFHHPTAIIDNGAKIGNGTKIWHFTHIMKGAKIGKNCTIGQNCYIASRASIGNGVKIENNVSIFDLVTLENNVFVGPSAVFINDKNPRAPYPKGGNWIPTLVKEGATIGANATILCGITIGRWAFVASGAVVTKDVKDYSIVKGNPARHAGWICECGEKLRFKKNRRETSDTEKIVCKKCGRVYKKEKDKIIQLS
ncbi:MAG: N-acetyltransferase [Candidatus Cloacimonas sp. 4484_209]|nr:MAG: N-acetyltransferase [Candidatus Cloacimonas sp. 4484_209]